MLAILTWPTIKTLTSCFVGQARHNTNRPGAQRSGLRGSGGRPSEDTTGELVRAFREHNSPEPVEVPGIEPGSSVALSGLLRAQFTMPLLGPTDHVN